MNNTSGFRKVSTKCLALLVGCALAWSCEDGSDRIAQYNYLMKRLSPQERASLSVALEPMDCEADLGVVLGRIDLTTSSIARVSSMEEAALRQAQRERLQIVTSRGTMTFAKIRDSGMPEGEAYEDQRRLYEASPREARDLELMGIDDFGFYMARAKAKARHRLRPGDLRLIEGDGFHGIAVEDRITLSAGARLVRVLVFERGGRHHQLILVESSTAENLQELLCYLARHYRFRA